MLLFDKMLIGGVRFVLDKLAVSVDQELNDDTRLREELLAAQMRVELGEMSQEAFEALEDEVLARIREIRERRGEGGPIDFASAAGGGDEDGGGMALDASSIGVEADFVADDWYPEHTVDEVEGEVVAVEEVPVAAALLPASLADAPVDDAPASRPKQVKRRRKASGAKKKAAPRAKAKAKPSKVKAKASPAKSRTSGSRTRKR